VFRQKAVSVKGQISAAGVVQISFNPSGPTTQELAVKTSRHPLQTLPFQTGVYVEMTDRIKISAQSQSRRNQHGAR
jgi:hypothetical protein